MPEHTPADVAADEKDGATEQEHPRGTVVLMMLFLFMIVAMWGWIYMILLQRAGR